MPLARSRSPSTQARVSCATSWREARKRTPVRLALRSLSSAWAPRKSEIVHASIAAAIVRRLLQRLACFFALAS